MPHNHPISERLLIFTLGIIQFVNVLDFMMIMPLGPDLGRALGIPLSQMGLLGGSYTAAAAVTGLLGAFFLDRFDHRKALLFVMGGLAIATFAGALAVDSWTLLAARVVAGIFGGPATSLTLTALSDHIPVERRGKAMGALMGAFSFAAILGVPASLEVARLGGWRLPFIGVGILAVLALILAARTLPQSQSRTSSGKEIGKSKIFRDPVTWASYLMMSFAMMSGFIIIPNISAYFQENLNYPRDKLGILYFIGGIVSFFALRIAGKMVDKWGSFPVALLATVGFIILMHGGFYVQSPYLSASAIFVSFMLIMSFRNVTLHTLNTKVPPSHERSSYQSGLSSMNHVGSALGSYLSTVFLTSASDGALIGVPKIALYSSGFALAIIPLMWFVESRVRSRDTLAVPYAVDTSEK